MKVVVQPELERDAKLRQIVEEATPILEGAIGRSSDRLTATWGTERGADGGPWIRLHLSHPYGEIATVFRPEQFADDDRIDWLFRNLWDDLLAEATHRQIQKLEAALE